MNAFELFFVFGPAIQNLFHLGMLPQNDDFVELTEEEKALYFKHNSSTDEKLFKFTLLAKDERFKGNVVCMTESEKDTLLKAVEFINTYGKDKTFRNDEEKLHYAASKLPDVFSEGTKFEKKKI